MPDAGGEALGVDRDIAPRRVLEVLREAAEPQRHVLHGDVRGLEPVEHHEAVPAAGVAEVDVQRAGLQPGAAAGHRQDDRRAGRVAEGAGEGEVAQEAVGAGLEVAVEAQRRAVDGQRRDAEAAARLADAADPDGALAGEEAAEVRGHQRRDLAAEVDVEAEARVARAQRDEPAGDPGAVGVEREGDVDVVDLPRALGGQVDRRLALDPKQGRDQAALRLVQVEVDVEPPVAFEKPARSVSSPPGPSRRRTVMSLSSTPRARLSDPPTEIRAAGRTPPRRSARRQAPSSARLTDTGSSGSANGVASALAATARSGPPAAGGASR